MSQTQIQTTLSGVKLLPIYPERAREANVNIAPGLTLAKGTVLGQITNSANDVQTISDTPTVSGGTFTISGTNPITGLTFTTAAIAYNASNATLKATLEAALGQGITVSVPGGTTLPGTDTAITFGGTAAGMPVVLMTINSSGLTGGGSLSIAHTTTGRTAGTYAAYNNGNSDGTEVAKAILPYDIVTDSAGKITFGAQSGGGVWGETSDYVSVYFSGHFKTSDLTGLDANGIADLGRLTQATSATAGILEVYGAS